MSFMRLAFALSVTAVLGACTPRDLDEPPVGLGNFKPGHIVIVTDKMQKVPISRNATAEEWTVALEKSMKDRFGRYDGDKFFNIGVSVDGYALAPPGIPLVLSPKSVLALTLVVFDDEAGKKLNKGERLIVFENLDAGTVVGSGLTKTKEEQIETLAYNAAKQVESYLVKNPEWFGLPPRKVKREEIN